MDVDRLFAEFCRTREPRLLGCVFDACTDDLFAVALHLSRDRTDAEDLVQATFLAAIARAHRWRPERPLRPWLLGILHREARQLRRRARREVDESRVNAPPPPEPPQLVLAAETRRAVAAAIPELPQPYRDVLALHLVDALPPGAIAERLQRSPGAVRTQLWRGLELLRGVLPAGLAGGLAASITAQAPLAAVRANVLAAAALAVAAAAMICWNWPAAADALGRRLQQCRSFRRPLPATCLAPRTARSSPTPRRRARPRNQRRAMLQRRTPRQRRRRPHSRSSSSTATATRSPTPTCRSSIARCASTRTARRRCPAGAPMVLPVAGGARTTVAACARCRSASSRSPTPANALAAVARGDVVKALVVP